MLGMPGPPCRILYSCEGGGGGGGRPGGARRSRTQTDAPACVAPPWPAAHLGLVQQLRVPRLDGLKLDRHLLARLEVHACGRGTGSHVQGGRASRRPRQRATRRGRRKKRTKRAGEAAAGAPRRRGGPGARPRAPLRGPRRARRVGPVIQTTPSKSARQGHPPSPAPAEPGHAGCLACRTPDGPERGPRALAAASGKASGTTGHLRPAQAPRGREPCESKGDGRPPRTRPLPRAARRGSRSRDSSEVRIARPCAPDTAPGDAEGRKALGKATSPGWRVGGAAAGSHRDQYVRKRR